MYLPSIVVSVVKQADLDMQHITDAQAALLFPTGYLSYNFVDYTLLQLYNCP